jgi:hypothetical protein
MYILYDISFSNSKMPQLHTEIAILQIMCHACDFEMKMVFRWRQEVQVDYKLYSWQNQE